MITTPEYLNGFYAEVFPEAADAPPKRWEASIADFLFYRGYVVESVREVLDHAAKYGTVECCPTLAFDNRDRAKVESLLPESHDWDRLEYQVTITLAGAPDPTELSRGK